MSVADSGSADESSFRIIDARPREEYLAGHIPGAVLMPWEEWCGRGPIARHPAVEQAGYWGLLSPAGQEWYGHRLGALGLAHDRPIVVYADGPRSMGREGRIAWMLLYLGAQQVYLLDGGWHGWRDSGGEIETVERPIVPARFAVALQPERRALFAGLRDAHRAGTFPLTVDTRTADEFAGLRHPYMPRMGHLPGAVFLPFAALFAPGGRFVDRDRYMALMPDSLRATDSAVTYCEVGVRASTAALLHEIHTGRMLAVYDGSLMEWALDRSLPVLAE